MQAKSDTPRLILLLAVLGAIAPLSIAIYLPSLPTIAHELGSSVALVQMTISVFLGGLCVGALLCGPLSERYGRRALLLGSIALYGVASLGCSTVSDVWQLLFCRFIQGLGAAGALVLARAVVVDLFIPTQVPRVVTLLHLFALGLTLVAPMAGIWLTQVDGWRTPFTVLASLALLFCLVTAWWVDESLASGQRNQSVGVALAGYLQVLSNRQAVSYLLCLAFCAGGLGAFVTAAPFVFIEYFGFSSQAFAGVFAVSVLAIVVATVINARRIDQSGPLALLKVGAWVAASAGLALAAASLTGWALPMVIGLCAVLYIAFGASINANCSASLTGLFARQEGALLGLSLAVQLASASVFSWLVSAFADGTPVPMCVAMGIGGAGCLLGFWGITEEGGEGEQASD